MGENYNNKKNPRLTGLSCSFIFIYAGVAQIPSGLTTKYLWPCGMYVRCRSTVTGGTYVEQPFFIITIFIFWIPPPPPQT